MKLHDGECLQDYGVLPNDSFLVSLPEQGGSPLCQVPINAAMFEELRADGLVIAELLCLAGVHRARGGQAHRHRVAFWVKDVATN